MKFHVKIDSKCIQRAGTLCEIVNKPTVSINTPTAMLFTQGGHIPHITHEVFKLVNPEPHILQIPLSGMHVYLDAMRCYNGTISSFIGSKDSLSCLTVQDPSNIVQIGHHRKDRIPIWTKSGKMYYDSTSYMDLVESFKPDLYFLLSDGDTNMGSANKRILKSVDNTLALYNECMVLHRKSEVLKNTFVIASIAGGYNLLERDRCIKGIAKNVENVGGFLIDGLHNNGPEIEFIEISKVLPIVQGVVNKLPSDKLRCVQGCWNPADVIKLVKLGIDLFDTSYCHILTGRSAAMTFTIEDSEEMDVYEINLRDVKYADDLNRIFEGCTCLTCTTHTRAYIHHLLTVRELLGPQLIMIHNIHHYLRFFEKIRYCIQNNRLDAFESKISAQIADHLKAISPP